MCLDLGVRPGLEVVPIPSKTAAELVIEHHYLHRRPSISFSYGLVDGASVLGVMTAGAPPSRQAQMSVCPSEPSLAIELNRLWVAEELPKNTESWFVSRALRQMPPRLVFSYADTSRDHFGFVYRALNFHYAGWTDMDRKTPRYDYIPFKSGAHTREAFRTGYAKKVRREPKVKYWIATGNRTERRHLETLCGWGRLNWHEIVPPGEELLEIGEVSA